MIISILNQKGGVGKTTLSLSLAAALAGRKMRVLLVDADPQGSGVLDWVAVRKEDAPFVAVGLPKNILHVELPKMAKKLRRGHHPMVHHGYTRSPAAP